MRGLAPGRRLLCGIRAGGRNLRVVSLVEAALRLAPHYLELGWDGRARTPNIRKLVADCRMLRPGVEVPNLASSLAGPAALRTRQCSKA